MKNRIGVLLILATIILPGIMAKVLAQTGDTNSITITQATGANSEAGVQGSYTIASGYTFVSITVDAQPTGEGGGEGGEAAGSTSGNGSFNGLVQVPPNLTYDVQAYLTVQDGSGNLYYYFSNMVTGVYVPNGP